MREKLETGVTDFRIYADFLTIFSRVHSPKEVLSLWLNPTLNFMAMVSWFLLTVRGAEHGEKFLGCPLFLGGISKKVHKPRMTPSPGVYP